MPRLPWPPLLLVLGFVVSASLQRIAPIAPDLENGATLALRALGITLMIAAFAVELDALRRFQRRKTTILPHRGATSLVTDGLHAHSRNPIYVAHIALTMGVGLVTSNPYGLLTAVALAFALHHVAVLPEERFLSATFGAEYDAYRSRVRRWL